MGDVTKTFGSDSTGGTDGLSIENAIITGKFQMGPTSGTADEITAYVKYKGLGRIIKSFASPSSQPTGFSFDSNDCIWHADSGAKKIYKLNQSGTVISSFAGPSDTPTGVGVDGSDCLWIANEINLGFNQGLIYKTDQTGSVVSSFNSPSSLPTGIDVDSGGCLWVVDASSGGYSIYKLNQSGTILDSFSVGPIPAGVGIDGSDCIWHIQNGEANKAIKYNQTGSEVSSFATPSSGPNGIGVDSGGSIWTCDGYTDKFYKEKITPGAKVKCAIFDSDGKLVANGTTTESTFSSTAGTTEWATFTFTAPKPSLTADEWYYLAIWSEDLEDIEYNRLLYDNTGGYGIYKQIKTYDSYPSTFQKTILYSDGLAPIYCTYTITAPEKPYESYISGFEARYKKAHIVGYFPTSGDIRSITVNASGHLLTTISGQTVDLVAENISITSGKIAVLSGNIGAQVSGGVQVSGTVDTSVSGNIVQISGQSVEIDDVAVSGTVSVLSGHYMASGIHVVTTGGGGGQVSGAVQVSGTVNASQEGTWGVIVSGDVNTSISGNIVQISGQHVVTTATADISGDAVWVASGDVSISGTVSVLSGHYMASGIHVVTTAVTADISGDVVDISGQNVRTGLATSMSTRIISVTAASGGTQLFGANNNRESVIVQNLLSGDIHLKESALQSGEGIKVSEDGDWNSETYRGTLYAVANISGNKISVMEESL